MRKFLPFDDIAARKKVTRHALQNLPFERKWQLVIAMRSRKTAIKEASRQKTVIKDLNVG